MANTVSVKLTADSKDAVAGVKELQGALHELGDEHVEPTVDADTDVATTRLDTVREKLAALSAEVATARADVDDDEALVKLSALEVILNRVNNRVVKPDVDLGGLARSEVDLAGVDSKLRDVTASAGTAGTELEKLDSDAGGASNNLDRFTKSADSASGRSGGGGLGGLMGAAIALAPALGTIGAVGVAGLSSVVAMAGEATVGLGAFALAAVPVITNIDTAATAQKAYNTAVANFGASSSQATTAQAALNAAVAQLTPAEQGAIGPLTDFKNAYQAWSQSFDPEILPVFTGGLDIARRSLGLLTPSVDTTANALQGLERSISTSLGSPWWQKFSEIVAGQASPAITTFGHLIGGTVTLLAGLDEAFAPLINSVEHGLNALADDMTSFGQHAQGDQGIQSFIAYVQKNAPLVGKTLEDLGHDFSVIAQDAAPLGPVTLKIVDAVAVLLGDLLQLNPTLTTWAIGIGSVGYELNKLGALSALKALPALFDSIVGSVAALGGAGSAASGLGSFITGASGATLAAGGLAAAGDALTVSLPFLGAALLQSTGAFDKFTDSSAGAAKSFAQSFVQGIPPAANAVQVLNQEIANLTSQTVRIGDVKNALDELSYADFKKPVYQLGALGQSIEDLGISGTTQASKAEQELGDMFGLTGDKAADLQKYSDELAASQNAAGSAASIAAKDQQDQADAMQRSLSPAQQLANAEQAFATAAGNASSDASTLNGYLATLAGNSLSAQAATLSQEQGLLTLAGQLKATGTSMSGVNTQSLTAQQSANQWASTLYSQLIPALAQSGASAVTVASKANTLVAGFDATLKAAGYTAAQIQALNAQYHLTPTDIKTAVSLTGASGVIQGAQGVQAALKSVEGTYVLSLELKEYVAGTAAAQTAIKQAQLDKRAGLAGGTNFWGGGITLVGEDGPELVNLPRGSQVLPTPASRAILARSAASVVSAGGFSGIGGGGGGDLVVTTPFILDGKTLAESTARYNITALLRERRSRGPLGLG